MKLLPNIRRPLPNGYKRIPAGVLNRRSKNAKIAHAEIQRHKDELNPVIWTLLADRRCLARQKLRIDGIFLLVLEWRNRSSTSTNLLQPKPAISEKCRYLLLF